ncbi:unnamed protein product [Ectocarpus sp. 12 AP-2014]
MLRKGYTTGERERATHQEKSDRLLPPLHPKLRELPPPCTLYDRQFQPSDRSEQPVQQPVARQKVKAKTVQQWPSLNPYELTYAWGARLARLSTNRSHPAFLSMPTRQATLRKRGGTRSELISPGAVLLSARN